jgi:hypothetical protein
LEGTDIESELGRIERFIRSVATERNVYFLLDNPSGPQFEPRHFFEGTRLSGLRVKAFQERIPLGDDQSRLGERLAQVAKRAGAIVIDPVLHLCPDGRCPVVTSAGKPIYKDDNHYRPFYVRESADFIDIALEN